MVEKYKIHKNFTRLKNISITKEVGNDFQLQDFNFQNMEAKVSIEDDLCLEDIEEREGLSHNDEKSEATNEWPQDDFKICELSDKQHKTLKHFTIRAQIHQEESESKINQTKSKVKRVQDLHEDFDTIEILSEEIIDVQDLTTQPPVMKINNISSNPEVNTSTVGVTSFLIGVLINVPLWILYLNFDTFSGLFMFIQLNFVPYSFGTIFPSLIQFALNKRMRKFVKEMLTDMFDFL